MLVMDGLGSRISSAFLLLAFNIGLILCQNVGQECPFSVPPQGEVSNKYNYGISKLQPPKNNIRFYPANGPTTGPIGAIAEYQWPPIQENFYPTCNQHAQSSPEPCPNFLSTNIQSQSDQSSPFGSFNSQGQSCPFSELLLNPNACPEPPITPYVPQNPSLLEPPPQRPIQPFSHGISRATFTPLSLLNPERPVQSPFNDIACTQGPPISSQKSVPLLRKFFTPLAPYRRSKFELACTDDAQPPPLTQSPSAPLESLNNQGCLAGPVDVLPLQQCTPEQESPIQNYPPLNLEPEPVLPSPPVNCVPQSLAIEPCDILQEIQSCLSIAPCPSSIDPFQDSTLLSPSDQCKVTRSLCSCSASSCDSCQPCQCQLCQCQPCQPCQPCQSQTCQSQPCQCQPYQCQPCQSQPCQSQPCQSQLCQSQPCHCSVCDDEPSLFQIQPCLQMPSSTGSFIPMHNIPSSVCNENYPSLRPYSDCRPSQSLNSECCSCANNDVFLPHSCFTPQSCCMSQTCGTPTDSYGSIHPQFSCDCSPPRSTCSLPSSAPVCLPSCEIPCHSPEPINVLINVPPPIIPAPSITIINTAPEPAPASIEDGYFDMSPMIIDSRRRRSNTWLPLLLVWLFSCDGVGGFGGCGGGSSDSGPIPIPFPIPIPT